MKIQNQIKKLLILEWLSSFRLGGSVWVLLLAVRGFSLAQIGLAEGVFHLVSLCGELPSGLAADLLGRRRVLVASQGAQALSALAMLFSRGMTGVLLSMALSALGYNLASGTREAMTYDSLAQAGREEDYLALSARQNVVFRLGKTLGTLFAGPAAVLGFQISYAADVLLSLAGMMAALSLAEPTRSGSESGCEEVPCSLSRHVSATARFLLESPAAVGLMLFNALVGALATLLGFYLQSRLPEAGAPSVLLGPLLLLTGLGGAAGSRLAVCLSGCARGLARCICALAVGAGCLLVAGGQVPLIVLGGFLATLGDDALELHSDAILQQAFPGAQRATLASVSSLCFSLIMVVLSPVGGLLVGG